MNCIERRYPSKAVRFPTWKNLDVGASFVFEKHKGKGLFIKVSPHLILSLRWGEVYCFSGCSQLYESSELFRGAVLLTEILGNSYTPFEPQGVLYKVVVTKDEEEVTCEVE